MQAIWLQFAARLNSRCDTNCVIPYPDFKTVGQLLHRGVGKAEPHLTRRLDPLKARHFTLGCVKLFLHG